MESDLTKKKTPEQLSPRDLDLALIAAQQGYQDLHLLDLIELADADMGLALGMLINGMIAVGTLAPPEAIAIEIDAERKRLAESFGPDSRPDDLSEEEWQQRLEEFSTVASDGVQKANKEKAQLEEQLRDAAGGGELEFQSLPEDLARRTISLEARGFLTLKNVQIIAPGQPGMMRLPVLRVTVSHVNAWWPIRLDKDGKASFQLFTTGADE
jgi:hypothetical protein